MKDGGGISHHRVTAVLLLILGLLSALAWTGETPPEPIADEGRFSAIFALRQLQFLLGKQVPHPTGTSENVAVRQRIVAAFKNLGYQPQQESSYTCDANGSCADVHNIIVPLAGSLPGPGVLLDAHYDSVGAGPGAADNASDVAIALEIARLLKHQPKPHRNVYILLDDAEEQGLLGSQAFVEQSPFFARVGWAVNLDARGVRGPSLMFETSQNNKELIHLYARVSHRPVANSLMYSLYQLLPSDTDFTNLRAHGIQGFNFAFLGGTGFYHREGDTLLHLDARSVQHQGEEAYALVEALATDSPLTAAPQGDMVYFDLFRKVIAWPRGFTWVLITINAALLLIGARVRNPYGTDLRSVMWGVTTPLVIILLAGAVSFGSIWLLTTGALLPPQFLAYPLASFLAASTLGLAVASGSLWLLPRWVRPWEFLLGQWLVACVSSGVLSVVLFGGSYLLVVPCLGAAIAMAVVPFCRWDRELITPQLALVSAILPAVLWVPLFRLLYQGVGLLALPVVCCGGGVECCLLMMALWHSREQVRSLAILSGASVLITALITVLTARYSVEAPLPLNIIHVQGEERPPSWLFAIDNADLSKISPLLRAAHFTVAPHPEKVLPWLASVTVPIYVAPAPMLPTASPALRIIDQQRTATNVCTHGVITAPPEETKIVLLFSQAANLRSIALGGRELVRNPAHSVRDGVGWSRYSTTNRPEGTDVRICLAADHVREVYLAGETYGLPLQGAVLTRSRPSIASPSQDGDITMYVQHVDLSAKDDRE